MKGRLLSRRTEKARHAACRNNGAGAHCRSGRFRRGDATEGRVVWIRCWLCVRSGIEISRGAHSTVLAPGDTNFVCCVGVACGRALRSDDDASGIASGVRALGGAVGRLRHAAWSCMNETTMNANKQINGSNSYYVRSGMWGSTADDTQRKWVSQSIVHTISYEVAHVERSFRRCRARCEPSSALPQSWVTIR